MSDPLIGKLLDQRYRILKRLGEGGMGLVYEALHEVLKTRVAIKVLRSETANDEESLVRLRREAQSASKIGSDHIVDVRDFGQLKDGSTYVVMELIQGVDLYHEVKLAPIEWRRAQRIAVQICYALHAAHEHGIVHRDLKGENVLLTVRDGQSDFVKIVDFGIAKVQGSAQITMAGRVMGTPEYMSPEQCAGVGVDHRTDIYSLGVLMYEMVTGRLPFSHQDLVTLVRMQMRENPEPPSEVFPDAALPEAFEALILRCLEKNPVDRFQSMMAVAGALTALGRQSLEGLKLPAGFGEISTQPDPDSLEDAEEQTFETPAEVSSFTPGAEAVPEAAIGPVASKSTSGRAVSVVGIAVLTLALVGAGFTTVLFLLRETPATPDVGPVATAARIDPTEVPLASDDPLPDTPVPVPETTIELISDPPAQVYEDGQVIGGTPMRLARPTDGTRRRLLLRQSGFEPHEIVIGELSQAQLRVVMNAEPPGVGTSGGPAAVPPPRTTPPDTPPAVMSPSHRDQGQFLNPWEE